MNRECLAIFLSGNHAMGLNNILKNRGYNFEIVATPCSIAASGCSYSIRFPELYLKDLLEIARLYGYTIEKVYAVEIYNNKRRYIEIPIDRY